MVKFLIKNLKRWNYLYKFNIWNVHFRLKYILYALNLNVHLAGGGTYLACHVKSNIISPPPSRFCSTPGPHFSLPSDVPMVRTEDLHHRWTIISSCTSSYTVLISCMEHHLGVMLKEWLGTMTSCSGYCRGDINGSMIPQAALTQELFLWK